MTDDIHWVILPEREGAGRLGRHVSHDPRSKRYAYNTAGVKITPVRHQRNVPVFDQGDLGSCTGNAGTGSLATDPIFGSLPSNHASLDEDFAVKVYSLATTLDDDPDKYPPTDTGSTGLAACKAMQQLGMIGGYQHTFTLGDALKALTITPIMFGTNWYDSFDDPDPNGLVKISKNAEVRGGHEIYADEITPTGVGFTNSWGTSWGVAGRFYMTFSTFSRLLGEDGDVTVPIASTTPTPNPAPAPSPPPVTPPTPTPDDVELWADMQRWAKAKGLS